MVNIIIIVLLIILNGLAIAYIYRSKKKGKACIGCPYSSSCGKAGGNSCGGSFKPKTDNCEEKS